VHRRRFVSTVPLGLETSAIAYGYGRAWIGTYDRQHSTAYLTRVGRGPDDFESRGLETEDGAGPLAVAVGDGSVWVVTSRGNLLRVDPFTLNVVRRVPMSKERPTLVAAGLGSVWTANQTGYSVSKIDPRTNRIVRTIPLGSYSAIPCGIATTQDAVLVTFGETTCV
jgi:streptogramin lyase